MASAVISEIEDRLRQLPAEKLPVVLDFVSYLVERQRSPETVELMLASEDVLRRDWERPEEDAAWASL